jgi:S1-C subfamily serine protease
MANATGFGVADSRPFVTGSGTLISAKGLILTNWHIVDMERHRLELQGVEDQIAEEEVTCPRCLVHAL